MTIGDTPRNVGETAKSSMRKATKTATSTADKAKKTVKQSARKAAGTAKATRAARAGHVEEAREIAAEADLREGVAEHEIAKMEALHYQVEVNKRGLSVTALSTTLNDRWNNGWRLAHILEQRGNTILVFEKRS